MTGGSAGGASLVRSVPSSLIDQLFNDPSIGVRPAGPVTQDITGALLSVQVDGLINVVASLRSLQESDTAGEDNIHKVLSQFYLRLQSIVARHEGDLVSFDGEQAFILFTTEMATSGEPTPTSLTANAVRCALKIIKTFHQQSVYKLSSNYQHGDVLRVTTAVEYGPMKACHVGSVVSGYPEWHFVLTGETVTEASKPLEEAAFGNARPYVRVSSGAWEHVAGEQFVQGPGKEDDTFVRVVKDTSTFVPSGETRTTRHQLTDQLDKWLRRYVSKMIVPRAGGDAHLLRRYYYSPLACVNVIIPAGVSDLQTIAASITSTAQQHHGSVRTIQFLASGIEASIVFTLPDDASVDVTTRHARNSVKALQCARDLLKVLRPVSSAVRLGISTGPSFSCVLDSPTRRTFVSVSPAIHSARRLSGAFVGVVCDGHIAAASGLDQAGGHGILFREVKGATDLPGIHAVYAPSFDPNDKDKGWKAIKPDIINDPMIARVVSTLATDRSVALPGAAVPALAADHGDSDADSEEGVRNFEGLSRSDQIELLKKRFAYGTVTFQNKRAARYVVAPDEEDIGDDFLYWLMDFWDLSMPKMLISVSGGAGDWYKPPKGPAEKGAPWDPVKNYAGSAWECVFEQSAKDLPGPVTGPTAQQMDKMKKFESRVQQLFSRGIARAAVKADAWVISGGTQGGVMELIGQAMRDSQWRVPLIGIATYKKIYDHSKLAGTNNGVYMDTSALPPNSVSGARLDVNHTNFVLIRNRGPAKWGVEVRFRFQMEEDLVTMVPAILLIANGGPGTADTVIASVRQARPILVIKGSGRFADELANLVIEKKEQDEETRKQKEEQKRNSKLRKVLAEQEGLSNKANMLGKKARKRVKAIEAGKDPDHLEPTPRTPKAEEGLLAQADKAIRDTVKAAAPAPPKKSVFGKKKKNQIVPLGEDKKSQSHLQLGFLRRDTTDEDHEADEMDNTVGDGIVQSGAVFVSTTNPALAEIVSDGDVHVFDIVKDDLAEMEKLIVQSLYKQPALEDRATPADKGQLDYAWNYYFTYDLNAKLAKKLNRSLLYIVMALNILVTFIAIIQEQLRDDGDITEGDTTDNILRYSIVIIPIITGIFISASNRFQAGSKWLLLRASAEKVKREIYRFRVRVGEYASSPDPKQDSRLIAMAKALDAIRMQLVKSEVNQSALTPVGRARLEAYKKKVKMNDADNRYSLMMPDDYYQWRVATELRYYKHKTPALEKELRRYQWSIYILTGGSALLGTFGVQLWIAVVTAITTTLTALLEYNQIQSRLMRYNMTVAQLENVQIWWHSLSAVEKASPVRMQYLVDTTESILESEMATWLSAQKAAESKMKKSQGMGEEGEEGEDEEAAADETLKVRRPAEFAKRRIDAIYNRRYGESPFPIKPQLAAELASGLMRGSG